MKNPFRFWMTGGIAILVAATTGGRANAAAEERLTLTHTSRYGVVETMHRIEASAQRHGLHVMACLPAGAGARDDSRLVVVLESSEGGTPVQMDTEDAAPDLLLSVVLERGDDGATQVYLFSRALRDLPDGLPRQVRDDLAGLVGLVDDALQA